jgi:hypothetical protein
MRFVDWFDCVMIFVIAMFFFDLLIDNFLISMCFSFVLSLCDMMCKCFALNVRRKLFVVV